MIVWCGSCETNTVDAAPDVSIEAYRPWCDTCINLPYSLAEYFALPTAPWVIYREEDYKPYTIDPCPFSSDGLVAYEKDGVLYTEKFPADPPKEDPVKKLWEKLGDVWRYYYPDLFGEHYSGAYANIIRSEN